MIGEESGEGAKKRIYIKMHLKEHFRNYIIMPVVYIANVFNK